MIVKEKKVNVKSDLHVSLRSPLPSESDRLLHHLRVQFHESYQNMNYAADHFDNFTVEQEAKLLEEICASSNRFFISAFYEGRIIGNVGVFGGVAAFDKHSAKIGLGIQKEFHNLGLGKALMTYASETALEFGITRLELTVRTHNPAGIKLYENCGFEKVGLLKRAALIDGAYCDELMFQKILT